MCPDGELLSAYYDDELDPVWDKQIAQHVSTCRSCSEKVASFTRLSDDLRRLPVPDFENSEERSWSAVAQMGQRRRTALWSKRVSVPIPAIAAAAAIFVAVVGVGVYFTVSGPSSRTTGVVASAQAQQDIAPVNFQVNNLNDLMSYLDSKDFGNDVTIQLPKGVDHLPVGKPQLVRAADFNRGQ